MKEKDRYFPTEIKKIHALKKIPDAIILFSLVSVVIALLIIVYKENLPVYNVLGIAKDHSRWILWYYRMDKLLHLTVLYGIAVAIIFSPISFVLRVKLTRLHVEYKKQDTGYHRELRSFKRTLARNMDASKIYYP